MLSVLLPVVWPEYPDRLLLTGLSSPEFGISPVMMGEAKAPPSPSSSVASSSQDLVEDQPFTRADIITLQDPQNMRRARPETSTPVHWAALVDAAAAFSRLARPFHPSFGLEHLVAHARDRKITANAAAYTGKAAASFTSTGLTLETSGGSALLTDDEFMLKPRWAIIISILPYTIGAALEAGSINFGNLVSLYQFNITLGEVLSCAIAAISLKVPVNWRFIPGSSLLFSIIMFISMLFLPESPRWQMQKDRILDSYVWKRIRGAESRSPESCEEFCIMANSVQQGNRAIREGAKNHASLLLVSKAVKREITTTLRRRVHSPFKQARSFLPVSMRQQFLGLPPLCLVAAVTVSDIYPLPRQEELIAALKVDPDHHEKLTLVIHQGLETTNVVLMGFRHSPPYVQR
ncbi:uncharacterized protein TRIVIDRAFT_222091 [Trichoderma virens Gv29-8]|uniref:Major facilitator superfamily (MFS) profile domain-containing protein n=1 Tax=Hypocrea virens (strain Gv29-8 / FGSC 10586) TaxID=413071 RepID=G9MRW0_HYPVG|nr:uncharacterized protein TRIVIDRAFT_222091 [Trichoderma virens Gv29-8]EHK22828.1 hypothetical protein TRIVIDRAFT_222091 [Trichoderma virens Gv29-8]UKZ47882.1 hypothetical protein TrVGV298_002116 [Trichoderma virens]